MATITEDYCDFETAKLLKEKGFNEPCHACYAYFSDDDIRVFDLKYSKATQSLNENRYPYVSIYVAMKWLREVHNISIEITSKGYLIDNDVEWECDIKVGHRLYFKHITNEKSFESCVEAAIKYCLENLI